MSLRGERVGDVVRRQLAQIVLRDMQDPRVELTSISRVRMSGDLRHAHVAISVLGNEDSRLEAVRALDRAKGFLRRRLAAQLGDLKVIPELTFELDRGAEHSQRISDLLEGLDDDSASS